MDTVYRKKGKRYIPCGYNNIPDISDGIWLVQSNSHSKSQQSLLWKVGDFKRPVDVVTHASLQAMESELSLYLIKLGNIDSDEYKEAKETYGGGLRGPVVCNNVSASDLVTLLLRQIAISIENNK
jgi:hypothetical protein